MTVVTSVEVPDSTHERMVVPVTVTSYEPLSFPPVSVAVTTTDGLTLDKKFIVLVDELAPSLFELVTATVGAAPYAVGTNAEPKSPASKPAVVTAVTSFFLIDIL
jgi:hypothetical protein